MYDIIHRLEKSIDPAVVIDTTGSVIYTGNEICNKLKELTTVVYLETPHEIQDKMYKLYLEDPKPVIWGDKFEKLPHETNNEALARCYPKLLCYRTRQYEKYADITLDYYTLRDDSHRVEDFLKVILHQRRSA